MAYVKMKKILAILFAALIGIGSLFSLELSGRYVLETKIHGFTGCVGMGLSCPLNLDRDSSDIIITDLEILSHGFVIIKYESNKYDKGFLSYGEFRSGIVIQRESKIVDLEIVLVDNGNDIYTFMYKDYFSFSDDLGLFHIIVGGIMRKVEFEN